MLYIYEHCSYSRTSGDSYLLGKHRHLIRIKGLGSINVYEFLTTLSLNFDGQVHSMTAVKNTEAIYSHYVYYLLVTILCQKQRMFMV